MPDAPLSSMTLPMTVWLPVMFGVGCIVPSLSGGGHDPVYPPSTPMSSPIVCARRSVLFMIVQLKPDRVPRSPDCEYFAFCGSQKLATHWFAPCSIVKPCTTMCCSPRLCGAKTRDRTTTSTDVGRLPLYVGANCATRREPFCTAAKHPNGGSFEPPPHPSIVAVAGSSFRRRPSAHTDPVVTHWHPEPGWMGSTKGLYRVPFGRPSTESNSVCGSAATNVPSGCRDHGSTSEALMVTSSPGAALYTMGAVGVPDRAGATRSLYTPLPTTTVSPATATAAAAEMVRKGIEGLPA
mmetsp:Transcript_19967/g.59727  ORF Transcript_19967/g.59727 Transcript_19967/m.59727 type:complete len:294 (-) Transcript_19967:171-1052(-)